MTTPIDKLQATQDEILAAVLRLHPEIVSVLGRVSAKVPFLKRQVAEYQGAVLYALAAQYNREGAMILEIGTAWGYSAACIATAASRAELITLNPKRTEYPAAIRHLTYTFKPPQARLVEIAHALDLVWRRSEGLCA